jgi:catechol 2,3-dioxygenase-like lactoylglutathione lyase family enzyme
MLCVVVRADAIGVIVSDLERAVGFYRHCGLEFPEPLDPTGHGHVEAALPGGMRFMLDSEESVRSFDPGWTPPSGGNRVAIAFLVDSPQEVDRAYAELIAAGGVGHKEPWDAFWGQRYAQLRDPDGNAVELFAPVVA